MPGSDPDKPALPSRRGVPLMRSDASIVDLLRRLALLIERGELSCAAIGLRVSLAAESSE